MPGYLKTLEISNFKSYKGNHTVGFMKFSAIIGPNGCGKSNLMDAISFVLGEKTSNLRVKSVKELIHGAPIGKPVATTAVVSAHYVTEKDGKDEDTIYSRKIVGSGTEYRINGKVVSNKEYQDSLISIGILIKAKNFLVFQGAVESIAMKTPKERTDLFEKISGSGALAEDYEKKKQAMQKAEEDTTFTLHKKKGINAEKKEAKAEKDEAEKYQKLNQDLIDAKLEAQLFKLYHTENDIKKIQDEMKEFEIEMEKVENRKVKMENTLKEKKSETGKLSRDISVKEKAVGDMEESLNKKRPLYLKAKQTTQHQVKKLEDSKKAHAKTKRSCDKQKQEIEELNNELDEVREMAAKFEEEMSQESEGQSLELMGTQIATYNRLKEEAGKKAAQVQSQLDKINRDQKSDQETLQQARQHKSDLLSRQHDLSDQRQQMLERIKQCDDYINNNVAIIDQHKEDLTKMEKSVKDANHRHSEIQDLLNGVQNQLNEAKVDKHESARNQRKAELIENLTRLFPGVFGRLADLVEPVHKRYAVAITKVLGKNMEAIVVDNEKTGRDCIQYMKEQRSKPETFLPLDTIKIKPINEQYRQIGGSAKLVIDVIKYEPAQIKKALLYACGSSLVCDTMEEARKLAFHGNDRKRTVALDGTLFERSGVISGGQSDVKQKAKRWDTKQIDNLKKQRDQFLSEIQDLNTERRKESMIQDVRSQVSGLESRLKYTKKNKDSMEHKLNTTDKREEEVIASSLRDIEPEIEKYEKSLEKRLNDITGLQDQKNKVEDELFADFCEQIGVSNIRQYEEKQLVAQQEKTQKRLEFQKQEGRLQNQLEYVMSKDNKDQLKKLEKSMKKIEDEIAKLKDIEKSQLKDIDKETDQLDKLRGERQALKTELEGKESDLKETKKVMTAIGKDEAAVQKKISTKERQMEEKCSDRHGLLKQSKMDGIKLPLKKGSLNDIEASSASQGDEEMEVDGDMSQNSGRRAYEREASIVINYSSLELRYKQLEEDKDIKAILQEMVSNVNKLESTVSQIQAPNMKATTKLDDVQHRLKETSDEFEQSRKRARKAKMEFEAVQKERYDKFQDAFEHVSQKIDDIYKELSQNPSAQAFLGPENAEEPYLEGISYNCVAPGKRFRPMDNLSGGEKTIAALALLFAIHSYQPSPFFVLDEIDAALDNMNINRVASYIRNQTDTNFQCIVISLKEEFYTKVDSLVGVTAHPDTDITETQTLTLDLTQYPE